MYRLALGNVLESNDELHKLGELFVTETIKVNLINGYFKEDSEVNISSALTKENSIEEIERLVDITKAESLLTPILKEWIEKQGYNATELIIKKIGELLQILYSEEAETPEALIEYLIYRMINNANNNGYYMAEIVEERLEEFKELLIPCVENEVASLNEELEDDMEAYFISKEDIPKRIEMYMNTATKFPLLYGAEKIGDDFSLILWDIDFTIFEEAENINNFSLEEPIDLF